MNPNQPQYSIDYLNQIAPQAPKRSLLSGRQLIVLGAIVLVLIIIMSIIGLTSSAAHSTAPAKTLVARLIGTQKIVASAQPLLASSKLRALNSNLNSYLTNANQDLTKPMALQGINTAKIDKNTLTLEANAAMSARLEDARLNVDYDSTYAREMTYQLDTIIALMHQINNSTTSASLKTVLVATTNNLVPTQKELAGFSANN